jgi:hypothetical protein
MFENRWFLQTDKIAASRNARGAVFRKVARSRYIAIPPVDNLKHDSSRG